MLLSDLSEQEIRGLVQRTLVATSQRRAEFTTRWLALNEQCEDAVRRRIVQTFRDDKVQLEVCRFASSIVNPIDDLTTKVARAYSTNPVRVLEGRSQEANKALLRTLERLRFNQHGRANNRYQVGMNTLAVVVRPSMYRGRPFFDFERVCGHAAEVALDPTAPSWAEPAILSYCLQTKETYQAHAVAMKDEPAVCVVDSMSFWYFDRNARLVAHVVHGLGRVPFAVLRSQLPEGRGTDAWWCPDAGRSVTQAMAEVGAQWAQLGWVRRSMFGKLVVTNRDPDAEDRDLETYEDATEAPEDGDTEPGQGRQPRNEASALPMAHAETVGEGSIKVEDFEVPVGEFKAHSAMTASQAARRVTGLASMAEDTAEGATPSDMAEILKQANLRQLQAEQAEYLRPFERDLLAVCGAFGLVEGIPEAGVIEDTYSVTFRPPTYLDTPEARQRYWTTEIKLGAASVVDYVMERDGSDRATARETVDRSIDEQADINEVRASRMSPADPTNGEPAEESKPEAPGESEAARTGRKGGRAPNPNKSEEQDP